VGACYSAPGKSRIVTVRLLAVGDGTTVAEQHPSHTKRDEIPLKEEKAVGMEKPSGIRILPVVPWARADQHSERIGAERLRSSLPMTPVGTIPDARSQPRFKIEVDITINSRTCGVLKGIYRGHQRIRDRSHAEN